MAAMRHMEIGQIVDYCIEWNKIHEPQDEKKKEKSEEVTKRNATQADWNALMG